MKTAFLFPGQGSQSIGMGKDIYATFDYVRQRYETANDALSFDLTKLIFEGSDSELQLTQNAQPAILTTSLAFFDVLGKEFGIKPDLAAGHSLGEYSALVASEALVFSEALCTVKNRGIYMQDCVPLGVGAMAAILGAEDILVEEACRVVSRKGHVVEPANYNCPGQLVVSGHKEAVSELCEQVKEKGAKRCIPLNVSAPFHCTLLQPAGKKLKEQDLDLMKISSPKFPYYANVDAICYAETAGIADRLEKQVYQSVMWKQSLQRMVADDDIEICLEVGPGNVTAGHMKKCSSQPSVYSTNTLENMSKSLKQLV